jgi:hypothetical protein
VTISAGVSLDKNDPLGTVFQTTNSGPWHLTDLTFGCDILPQDILATSNIPGQEPLSILFPGETATRDCAFHATSGPFRMEIPDPEKIRVDVIVHYHWPLVGWEDRAIAHFAVRRYAHTGELVLTPDIQR